jgi:RNA polymerase sigma-70 factor (ECF subfamily)
MDEKWLADRFGAHRARLRSVAYRMLGSTAEADDAVQEVWLRLGRSESDEVENLGGWLTTVLARVCLDMLRARKAHPVMSLDVDAAGASAGDDLGIDPEHELMLADSVGPALMVVLETLAPAERVAFVLHDLFGLAFEEIANIVGRSPMAARKLASRARQRVRGADVPEADRERQREVVGAFLTAVREGDFDALLALLDPGVVLRADDAATALRARTGGRAGPGVSRVVQGANDVAATFSGRARAARLALVDGDAAAVWIQGGALRVIIGFEVVDRKIVAIQLTADPADLGEAHVVLLDE